MTDSKKIPDELLGAPPLTEGSKDMGGYFFHWRRGKGVDVVYMIQTSQTKDGQRSSATSAMPGRVREFKTPSEKSIFIFHVMENHGQTHGALHVSNGPFDVEHPSYRVN